MKTKLYGLIGMVVMAVVLTACQTTSIQQQSAAANSTPKVEKGGAQLWADNCSRCHNFRSPSSQSDAGWEVAMHHMRLRANLTSGEHQAILEFLQSGN